MKKFIVKFGCFDLGLMKTADLDTLCEETTNEEKKISNEKVKKFLMLKKEEILLALKKEPSITSIEPLEQDSNIKRLFSFHNFGEPIKFKIKLPFKNQEISRERFYYNKKRYEVIEDFNILLSQNLFLIYQEVNPTKFDFVGGPDIRVKLLNILKSIFPKSRIVPPTPFRDNFIYFVSYPDEIITKERENNKYDFIFSLDETDFEKEIYEIFHDLEFYLHKIYQIYDIYNNINTSAYKIIEAQKELNIVYKDFIDSNFYDNYKNDKKKSIKLLTLNLCEFILDYVSAVNQFEVDLSQTVFHLNKTPLENCTTSLKNEVNEYVRIDVDALYKYIESITNDVNTRSVNFSTIIAGIIGGIIGSVGAIIVTIINNP